ncbi:tetratricopeptide repeat protein [Spirulina sp. 06S082]|uniref:tetratricopeptide repeat protein n=1 Tax=Spirulina sp. 06S082 TaxID=3110248 RepID=UPI002B1ED65F|nr:tetratricopeptide repeat protein [Spirulina sp. 06S082]MEA5468728.1 tetratricopeptide repeat protein [Spirulina sp. 06S082]
MARPKLVEGSIENAVARLSLWCRRKTQGLARVSFSSEFARREVVEQLKLSLREGDIPFHEIHLPLWEHPSVVLNFLLDRLESIESGVVSVNGWATAIAKEIPLSEGLRVINFNRERLVRPSLRQIWWMSRSFAIEASRAMPDLSSCFLLRLSVDIDFARTNSVSLNFRGLDIEARTIPSSSISELKSTPPQNLPLSGNAVFVGREQDIEGLHERLQQADKAAIAAITGMGGVGKSALALQYALRYGKESYSGGICWLHARDRDIGIQIINYCRTLLGFSAPDGLNLLEQVHYCWTHWPDGDVLIVFDDVSSYAAIQAYLPPDDSRFKVLLTTRLRRLEGAIEQLSINVLEESAALELLKSLLGSSRIESETEQAKYLCEWLGYLPLGLELVGHYLVEKPDLSLSDLRQQLEAKILEQKALRVRTLGMAVELDIAAVFELSWLELNSQGQELFCLLGLFAFAPIPWGIVKNCFPDLDGLNELRDRLIAFSLLNPISADIVQLHPLIREFAKRKIESGDRADELKQKYCREMVKIAKQIPQTPTLKNIEQISPAIPHLIETVTNLIAWVRDEDLIWTFVGLGRYYQGQGLYTLAEPWLEQCLSVTRDRWGEEHPDVATSLNNLALLYQSQGRYEEAEPLLVQSLELSRKRLGEDHLDVALSLNSLALLYQSQGRYEEAEPLLVQALELIRKLLGEDHPDVASVLNNLATLYESQGRYEEAEPLYVQSLELIRKLLGEDHPNVASSLNNLAALYQSQGRYEEAEPLYVQSLELIRKLLGEDHPNVASILNNLARLYESQDRYQEAESLYLDAVAIALQKLGDNHPHTMKFNSNFKDFLQQVISKNKESELSENLLTQNLLSQLKNTNSETSQNE